VSRTSITEYSYSLTNLGKTMLEQMKDIIDTESLKELENMVKWTAGKNTQDLVKIAKEIMKNK
jgi:hypothetical protein